MSTSTRLRQAWTIAAMQLRRVFFARRSLWVYALALFPALAFFTHGVEVVLTRENLSDQITSPAAIARVREGDTPEQVLERAGEPVSNRITSRARTLRDGRELPERRRVVYFDGRSRWYLTFTSGELTSKSPRLLIDFSDDRLVFAGIFQYFYLRLAIFFGCLGIFMNLFRGEMLDQTLHFWFLAPARREVLLLGKYLAGLIASVVIFSAGAALCFLVMLWPQESAELAAFWPDPGVSHLFWYCAAAALACVGYGSVFLAAGLLLRNPIIPAIVMLFWEGINPLLPAMLQKLSVLYYVQALTPVGAPTDPGAPLLIQLLMSPAEPPSTAGAVLGLVALTAVVLWVASHAVRRLEINYSTD
jgi:ABC-type transport system involved in multi-copper enzyme maturation permease subunit